MYGIILIVLGILITNTVIYSIGLGLFIDELGYIIIGGKTHEDNYSSRSLLFLISFIILIYLLRDVLFS